MKKYRRNSRKSVRRASRRKFIRKRSSPSGSQCYVNEKFRSIENIHLGGSIDTNDKVYGIACSQISDTDLPGRMLYFDRTNGASQRWVNTHVAYEQYAVKGVKIKYIPSSVTGDVMWHSGAAGSDFHTA